MAELVNAKYTVATIDGVETQGCTAGSNPALATNLKQTTMFKKLDAFMDRAMDNKWFRGLIFTILMLNALLATVGVILMAVMLG